MSGPFLRPRIAGGERTFPSVHVGVDRTVTDKSRSRRLTVRHVRSPFSAGHEPQCLRTVLPSEPSQDQARAIRATTNRSHHHVLKHLLGAEPSVDDDAAADQRRCLTRRQEQREPGDLVLLRRFVTRRVGAATPSLIHRMGAVLLVREKTAGAAANTLREVGQPVVTTPDDCLFRVVGKLVVEWDH